MRNWKAWVFSAVTAATLILLWKALDNIRSTPTIQLDATEIYQQIEDDNIAYLYLNPDGAAEGRLRSGEFFYLPSVLDRADLIMRLEERDVDFKVVESGANEFLENTVPAFIVIGLSLLVFFVARWARNRKISH